MIANIQRSHRSLPHWRAPQSIYFVTFRLHDSLPAALVADARFEIHNILRTADQMHRDLSDDEQRRLRCLRRQLELALDKGYGKCWMRNPAIAEIVTGALSYFHHERYELLAWCVMPNHVHAIVQPGNTWDLSQIMHSWKSFTAHRIVREYRCPTPFWQHESYDRIMRDEQELRRAVRYVENNPAAAGLAGWRWVSSGHLSAG